MGIGRWQSDKSNGDFKGKPIKAHRPLLQELAASVFIRKYSQPWNTVPHNLLYLDVLNSCKKVLKARSPSVPTYLILHLVE